MKIGLSRFATLVLEEMIKMLKKLPKSELLSTEILMSFQEIIAKNVIFIQLVSFLIQFSEEKVYLKVYSTKNLHYHKSISQTTKNKSLANFNVAHK
jgi:hypothetical protein